MRKATIRLSALLACGGVIAALAMAVPAMASAHEFTSTEATTLEVVKNETQVFKLVPSSSEAVECTTEKIVKGGAVPRGSFTTVEAEVAYSGCHAVHTALGTLSATVSNAQYKFNANEYVSLLNEITINASGLCTIKVKAQSPLELVLYEPLSSGNMLINPQVDNIAWSKSGLCGSASGTEGTYKGTTEVHGPESELSWK